MSKATRADLVRLARPLAAEFFRHVALRRSRPALAPSNRGGRWAPRGINVLYFGRPSASVVAEAYRLLGDPGGTGTQSIPTENFLPRERLTISAHLESVVDLTGDGFELAGLSTEDLSGDFAQCQELGAEIERKGFEAVLAPSATGLGETLAVFESNLRDSSNLELLDRVVWTELPPDPRAVAPRIATVIDEPYISAEQLAWRLGKIDSALIARWRAEGMPSLRISERKFIYRFSEVESWLRERRWE